MNLKQVGLSLLIIVICTSFILPRDWIVLNKTDFSIEFPVMPVADTQTVNTALGDMVMYMYNYDASASGREDDNFFYSLITSVYPGKEISSDNTPILEGFFRGSVDGAVTNVKGKLLSEKNIELNGYPGRDVKVDYGNGAATINLRMYLVKNKMYMLQTITKTNKDGNSAISRFLNSFRLNS
jgi:hypothetical protein